ncbi:MAG: IS1634 family transposase, partial [Calditrichaeota bacterium]|nr:IS1634 family transposase [Calditrichota bacterium]
MLKQSGQLQRLRKRLDALSGESIPSIRDLQERNRFCYGDIVYRKLWKAYQFDELLSGMIRGKKVQFDFLQTVYLLIIDRLLEPGSKLSTYHHQDRYIHLEEISLHHLYRSLDILAEGKETIERHIF